VTPTKKQILNICRLDIFPSDSGWVGFLEEESGGGFEGRDVKCVRKMFTVTILGTISVFYALPLFCEMFYLTYLMKPKDSKQAKHFCNMAPTFVWGSLFRETEINLNIEINILNCYQASV
jgi:hypothetical protein